MSKDVHRIFELNTRVIRRPTDSCIFEPASIQNSERRAGLQGGCGKVEMIEYNFVPVQLPPRTAGPHL